MTGDEFLQKLAPWREAHTRLVWKPQTVEGDGPLDAHKFSGTPWLAADEPWPRCPGCKQHLQLFLQLNLGRLPEEIEGRFGEGLLQLFYCASYDCELACGAWEPFSPAQLVRVVHVDGRESQAVEVPEGQFPPRLIVGWDIDADLPSAVEHEFLGLDYAYDFQANTLRLSWREAGLVMDTPEMDIAESIGSSLTGDKSGGWPHWVQGVEYPSCPRCGGVMEMLFQIDSENNLPYMFGDVGIGHITQCPEHRDVVAFGWACY
jgi:uncharacterized protein YwqG